MSDRTERQAEDFKLLVLCTCKGNPAMYELLRDRTLDAPQKYKIVRHHFKKENEVIVRDLTLEQAQAHCERDDTHGDGWFDDYTEDIAGGVIQTNRPEDAADPRLPHYLTHRSLPGDKS